MEVVLQLLSTHYQSITKISVKIKTCTILPAHLIATESLRRCEERAAQQAWPSRWWGCRRQGP